MSADILRRAASLMRERAEAPWVAAVADWLEATDRRHGPVFNDRDTTPRCNFVGCYENAIDFPCDDYAAALAVARAYLGESS